MGALDAGCCFEDELDDGYLEVAAEEIGCESGVGSGSDSARAIEDAVRVLLQGLGEDHEREGLRRTPHRVAKAFREGTRGGCLLPYIVFLDLPVGPRCSVPWDPNVIFASFVA